MTGAIYDIGYRGYDGPRLGRRGALRALFTAGLRAEYGLGRSFRAKIWPFGAVVLALLPALVAVALPALLNQRAGPGAAEFLQLFTYDTYLWQVGGLLPLFLAAQAPELVISDRRYQVLPLYFSRPIHRADYLVARWASLAVGLLALTLLPVLVLWIGTVLLDADVVAAAGEEAGALPQIVATGLLYAAVLSVVALAISAYAGRRAYGSGAVIALFLVGGALGGILSSGTGGSDWAVMFDPLAVLDGARDWLIGGPVAETPAASSSLPLWTYGAVAGAYVVAAVVALAWRYRSDGS
jgi:ABC-2 type transport system permease protein